jgi:hypothetical protein
VLLATSYRARMGRLLSMITWPLRVLLKMGFMAMLPLLIFIGAIVAVVVVVR